MFNTNIFLSIKLCLTKQKKIMFHIIFYQYKIMLERTLIVSNLKMINKISPLPPGKISADAHERFFVTFVLLLITNWLFLSVLSISVSK